MNKIKLEPCPFCGSLSPKIIGSDKYSDYIVRCYNCGASSDCCNSKEEAVEAWNRRSY